ncbi:MAG: serine/threonine protein kinase [Chthoniobacterales bacterium]
MTGERWLQLKEILADALEIHDGATREKFVADACEADTAMRREVELFLAQETDPLEKFAAGADASAEIAAARENTGRRVGSYELLRELGRGGMGAVYLARRTDGLFEQTVAIKLLKRGTDTDEVLRRFRAEREILARLEHPNIARLLDGGTTTDGLPYFVMEYVEGMRVTDYCFTQNLAIVERLKLFRKICAAVHFAHQNLVVHRDLKPANIVVTASGEIKLLDFGIAKLVQEAGENSIAHTLTAHRLMTPEYASPEQLTGAAVTTVSDVYSLGVILYELMAGARPFRSRTRDPGEWARVLAAEPTRPSAIAAGATAAPLTAAERKSLRGDIDNIVLKALRHDATRRYGSVEAMSEDLRRYLEGLPVRARPDTSLYRTSKFIARHRVAVASAVIVLLACIAGTITTAWQAHRARYEEAVALRRFAELRRLTDSYLFEIHDAIRNLPGSTNARQLLVTRALEYLDRLASESSNDRALQLELANAYLKVGDVQGKPYTANLGDSAGALRSYARAAGIAAPFAERESGATSTARRVLSQAEESLGLVQSRANQWEKATASHQRSRQIRERLLNEDPARAVDWELGIVANDVGLGDAIVSANRVNPAPDFQRTALTFYRRALALGERVSAVRPNAQSLQYLLAKVCTRIATELSEIGSADGDAAAYRESTEFHLRAVALDEAMMAADPGSAPARRTLADELIALSYLRAFSGEDLAAARADCERARGIMEGLAASDPANAEARQDLSTALYVTARVLQAQGDPGAADAFRRCLTILEPLVADHPENVETSFDLSRARKGLAEVSQAPGAATGAVAP